MKRLLIFVILLTVSTAFAQGLDLLPAGGQEEDRVSIEAKAVPEIMAPGGSGKLMLLIDVKKGWHIGAGNVNLFDVVPKPADDIKFGVISLPKPKDDEYGQFYDGRVEIGIPFTLETTLKPHIMQVKLDLTIQPCSEDGEICYQPETRELTIPIKIDGKPVESTMPVPGERELSEGGIAGRLTIALERGSILAFLLVFLGGVLASLTPCVYPMIPITIAVIGARATGGKLKGFVLSLFYVLGIALTFTALGVAAAKTGALFGSAMQHPVVVTIIAVIFFIMGLSLMGVFVMQMPTSIASKLQGKKGKGFLGAFLTGLVAGLVVSPCVSPLLVVILTWVARTGSVLLGASLLFSFALGLGVLFIILGTFSGVLKSLPRSGGWMDLIEKGFGLLLIVLALVFVRPVLPSFYLSLTWSAFLIFLGVLLGAFGPVAEGSWRSRAGKTLGLFSVIVAAVLIFFAFAQKRSFSGIAGQNAGNIQKAVEDTGWLSSDEEGMRQARLTGKPILIDFFAEWCAACHELDERTWPDPEIKALLEKYVLVKLDLTRKNEQVTAWQDKYRIVGMPTVILLDKDGNEKRRFAGFKPPKEVAGFLKPLI